MKGWRVPRCDQEEEGYNRDGECLPLFESECEGCAKGERGREGKRERRVRKRERRRGRRSERERERGGGYKLKVHSWALNVIINCSHFSAIQGHYHIKIRRCHELQRLLNP